MCYVKFSRDIYLYCIFGPDRMSVDGLVTWAPYTIVSPRSAQYFAAQVMLPGH